MHKLDLSSCTRNPLAARNSGCHSSTISSAFKGGIEMFIGTAIQNLNYLYLCSANASNYKFIVNNRNTNKFCYMLNYLESSGGLSTKYEP